MTWCRCGFLQTLPVKDYDYGMNSSKLISTVTSQRNCLGRFSQIIIESSRLLESWMAEGPCR